MSSKMLQKLSKSFKIKPFFSQNFCHKLHHISSYKYIVGGLETPNLKFEIGISQKSLKGEDSYFGYGDIAFGVADGVGGYSVTENNEKGSVKRFSQGLMDNCVELLDRAYEKKEIDLINNEDFADAVSEPWINSGVEGGSTLIFGILKNGYNFHLTNIGDSRCFIFRTYYEFRSKKEVTKNLDLYWQSPEQIQGFNAPIHIGPKKSMEMNNSSAIMPSKWADNFEIKLVNGDLIVMCTDGVTDNLFPGEILRHVLYCIQNQKDVDFTSKYIVDKAVEKSRTSGAKTPFGYPKPDDTTCVVALVLDRNPKKKR